MSPQKIGNYQLVRTLGRGAFGTVELANHVLLGTQVAIKKIDTSKMGAYEKTYLHREALIIAQLNHPNIVRLIEIYSSESLYCLVLQYLPASQNLHELVRERGPVSENFARGISRQIVSALWYLSTKNILHRDLKLDNLLVASDGIHTRCLLIDFGLSDLWHPDPPTFYGTVEYAAPESFGQEPMHDVWSFGVVMFAMLTGSLPFNTDRRNHSRYERLIKKVARGLTEVHDNKMKTLSNECRLLIKECLDLNPMSRIKISEIATHVWFTKDWGRPVKYVAEQHVSSDKKKEIAKDVHTYLHDVPVSSILSHIDRSPYGRIGGIFNLLVLKKQEAQLLAERSIAKIAKGANTNDNPSYFEGENRTVRNRQNLNLSLQTGPNPAEEKNVRSANSCVII